MNKKNEKNQEIYDMLCCEIENVVNGINNLEKDGLVNEKLSLVKENFIKAKKYIEEKMDKEKEN